MCKTQSVFTIHVFKRINANKTFFFSGRVHHAIGNYRQAVQYLQQGLQIAEQLSRKEDEAKIRHRLGLALWGHADLEGIGFSCSSPTRILDREKIDFKVS